MNQRLSPQMLKTLDTIKKETIEEYNRLDFGETKKVVHKSTKHKTLTAVIINVNKPAFKLFINDHFYAIYFLKDGKWQSER